MSVELRMEPLCPVMSWADFCKSKEPFSIAIDGYVAAGPSFDETGPRANFNHHEEVDRLATRATCAQVLIAIRQGLFDCFSKNGTPTVIVYANDCDEDVCTSWFLLNNSHLAEHTINPLLNRLVSTEELMDATAGAYPLPASSPVLEELAWIFEPYRRFRVSGEIDKREARSFEAIVTDVGNRIMLYISGRGEKIPLDTRFEKMFSANRWSMIREVGANAKTGMFANGIKAYVSARERTGGRWSYTVGRMSQFINFDVLKILSALSIAESEGERWGGGNTIGGSPRASGSRLSPEEVIKIVNSVIE